MGHLYYGDNLAVLRQKIKDETVDLCYIDPPFNSKRNYFQIYNNIGKDDKDGKDDKAQAQAFSDTWTWDDNAMYGYQEIITNFEGRFTRQVIELMQGLRNVLGAGSLLAYLVSMTLRIIEIQRILTPTGNFYLHCDPTTSHYLKLVLDAVFCMQGGEFRNEIVWHYRRWTNSQKQFQSMHDIILFYSKTEENIFNLTEVAMSDSQLKKFERGWDSNVIHTANGRYTQLIVYNKAKFEKAVQSGQLNSDKYKHIVYRDKPTVAASDVIILPVLNSQAKERLGYPTQKPEALLERIITAGSNEGGVVLDAYCGCGTTIAVAQRLKRQWIGIDSTYQSISLILKRLEDTFGQALGQEIVLDGIPQDMASARALANKKDDRVRKEFEKWAVLTYSNNRAVINSKPGADKGIDGIAYFLSSPTTTERLIFQVKSGNVNRGVIATLRGDMEREKAAIGILITLEEPTTPMREEAAAAGLYEHPLMGRSYHRIQIVTIKEMLEQNRRLEMPFSLEVLKSALATSATDQMGFSME